MAGLSFVIQKQIICRKYTNTWKYVGRAMQEQLPRGDFLSSVNQNSKI